MQPVIEPKKKIKPKSEYFQKIVQNLRIVVLKTLTSSKNEDYWENEADGLPDRGAQASSIDIGNTSKVKEKLIRILAGDVTIPKQRWSLCRILVTLVYHWKDLRLCSAFCQFSQFAYQTMMTESELKMQWPEFLLKKDCNLIIWLRFWRKMEKRYNRKV